MIFQIVIKSLAKYHLNENKPFTFTGKCLKKPPISFQNFLLSDRTPKGRNEMVNHDILYRHTKLNWFYSRSILGKKHLCNDAAFKL